MEKEEEEEMMDNSSSTLVRAQENDGMVTNWKEAKSTVDPCFMHPPPPMY